MTNVGTMFNTEIPFNASNKTSFYAFGGFNSNRSDAYAFTRNFSARPDRFPTDNNGDLIFVSDIMRKNADGETYYNPIIQTHINDISLAEGIKGELRHNWSWDFSNVTGDNNFHFYGDKTFNAGLGCITNAF